MLTVADLPKPGSTPFTTSLNTARPRTPLRPATTLSEPAPRFDSSDREFIYSEADFERVRSLIYKRAGISLSPVKHDMVYSRLARRLRAKSLKTFKEYLDRLESGVDPSEWEAFVNSLTTNLTSFFREAHHFDILADYMRGLERRPIKIWCSAASTGEEPYSLAITACEVFGSMTPPVQIIASDLDTNVLAQGERGVYAEERIERMDRTRVQKFFLRGTGTQDGFVRVRPELQRLISFRRVNLLDRQWPLQGPFDVMFCRNVMIYFDKQTQYDILERFLPLLREDGLLFAGHSENFIHAAKLFRSLGRTVYARASTGTRA
jgi:chemotaxis protein methyltransferase CheR